MDKIQTVAFWDAQAPWQQKWLAHCDYHRELLALLRRQVRPGWRVLDLGAGSGILAVPLQLLGCRVTALEPSRGMRGLLRQRLRDYPEMRLRLDPRPWEEVPLAHLQDYQLILACNSLQATTWGFARSLKKIFQAAPAHVCVIAEDRFLPPAPCRAPACYRWRWRRQLVADSSMAYHSLAEVWEHFRLHWGRNPTPAEKAALQQELIYHEDHYWLKQQAHLTVFWWSRISRGDQYVDGEKMVDLYPPGRTAGEWTEQLRRGRGRDHPGVVSAP